MMDEITILPETPVDYTTILRLTYEAFLTLDYPGRQRTNEHYLIHLLKNSPSVIRELCFVAKCNGKLLGHILYTKSKFQRPDGSQADTITFGPLSVLPTHHKQGIGKALVAHSMAKAKAMGFGAVLIIGVPDYYPKLGFQRASTHNLTLADGTTPDFFMAYELTPGYLHGGGVSLGWAPEFSKTEHDHAGFQSFHRQFMAEHFPEPAN